MFSAQKKYPVPFGEAGYFFIYAGNELERV